MAVGTIIDVETSKGNKYSLRVIYDAENLNIRVFDSYKVNNKSDIIECVIALLAIPEFDEFEKAGFRRRVPSMVREWAAHNFMYEKGYAVDHTKDVDLDNGESWQRRFCYFFMSLMYRTLPPKETI